MVLRLNRPAHVFTTEEVTNEKPWYYDIKHFLQTQEYPIGESNKDRKTLRRLAGSFFLSENVLYKRNHDMVLLRCVDRHEANMLMHMNLFPQLVLTILWNFHRVCDLAEF